MPSASIPSRRHAKGMIPPGRRSRRPPGLRATPRSAPPRCATRARHRRLRDGRVAEPQPRQVERAQRVELRDRKPRPKILPGLPHAGCYRAAAFHDRRAYRPRDTAATRCLRASAIVPVKPLDRDRGCNRSGVGRFSDIISVSACLSARRITGFLAGIPRLSPFLRTIREHLGRNAAREPGSCAAESAAAGAAPDARCLPPTASASASISFSLSLFGEAVGGQMAHRVMRVAIGRARTARRGAKASSRFRADVPVENEGAAVIRFRLGIAQRLRRCSASASACASSLVLCRTRHILFGDKCQFINYQDVTRWMRLGFSRRSIGPAHRRPTLPATCGWRPRRYRACSRASAR